MAILTNGDTLRLTCSFQHKGKAFTGAQIYAAIGKRDTWFNEVQGFVNTTTVTGIKDDVDWTTYSVTVDIPIFNIGGIGGAVPGADYEVYAKMLNIPGADLYWYGPLNDITLEAVGAAEFRNLSVTYQKKL